MEKVFSYIIGVSIKYVNIKLIRNMRWDDELDRILYYFLRLFFEEYDDF